MSTHSRKSVLRQISQLSNWSRFGSSVRTCVYHCAFGPLQLRPLPMADANLLHCCVEFVDACVVSASSSSFVPSGLGCIRIIITITQSLTIGSCSQSALGWRSWAPKAGRPLCFQDARSPEVGKAACVHRWLRRCPRNPYWVQLQKDVFHGLDEFRFRL